MTQKRCRLCIQILEYTVWKTFVSCTVCTYIIFITWFFLGIKRIVFLCGSPTTNTTKIKYFFVHSYKNENKCIFCGPCNCNCLKTRERNTVLAPNSLLVHRMFLFWQKLFFLAHQSFYVVPNSVWYSECLILFFSAVSYMLDTALVNARTIGLLQKVSSTSPMVRFLVSQRTHFNWLNGSLIFYSERIKPWDQTLGSNLGIKPWNQTLGSNFGLKPWNQTLNQTLESNLAGVSLARIKRGAGQVGLTWYGNRSRISPKVH